MDSGSEFDDQVIYQVTRAIAEDFCEYSKNDSVSGESLIKAFLQVTQDAANALRKVSTKTRKDEPMISSVIYQLDCESRAYTLLLELANSSRAVESMKTGLSVFDDEYIENIEFRKLIVLLRWCEKNAFDEPDAKAQLSQELDMLQNCKRVRAETALARQKGQDFCDVDLDGDIHGNVHPLDEELQSRIYSVVYTLVRCGQINEAASLLQRVGLPALVPSLLLRNVSRDATMSSLCEEDESFNMGVSMARLKKTVKMIIDEDCPMSKVERSLWAIIAGSLEPVLSFSTRTEDRLWCYLNAAVESRMERAFINHGIVKTDAISEASNEDDLMISSIFGEIVAVDDSPYYPIYQYLILDDPESMIDFIFRWVKSHETDLPPHVLRFMAHLMIAYMQRDEIYKNAQTFYVVEKYIEILIVLKLYTLVPAYSTFLSEEDTESILVAFMHKLSDTSVRMDVLSNASSVGINGALLCEKIFNYAMVNAVFEREPSEHDQTILNAWSWLTYPGNETIIAALLGCNYILRKFFVVEKLNEARTLLKKSSGCLSVSLVSYLSEEYGNEQLPVTISNALSEYKGYITYLDAVEQFDRWFKTLKNPPPDPAKHPDEETWSRMDMQLRAITEYQQKKSGNLVKQYNSTVDTLYKMVVGSLEGILVFPGGWLHDVFIQSYSALREVEEMVEVEQMRGEYLSKVVSMLITVYDLSNCRDGIKRLVIMLADEKNTISKLIPKEHLRKYVKQLSVLGPQCNSGDTLRV
ncbi:hypothetical protein AB6A40_005133 [Gnathostoma spinigerum]|uniref:Nuclear pore complex protein n=1 Tax=Gnathostoma spinigerum TaxID=75299 RepID=A0ABD6EM76_9BILA